MTILTGPLVSASAAGEERRADTRDRLDEPYTRQHRDERDERDERDGRELPLSVTVTGDAIGPVRPGGADRPIDLMIQNPFTFPVTLTAVDITVDRATTRSGCDGPTNLVVARPFSGTATIPARTTTTLSSLAPAVRPAQWPTVRMPDLGMNQDACRGARFALRYTARFSR